MPVGGRPRRTGRRAVPVIRRRGRTTDERQDIYPLVALPLRTTLKGGPRDKIAVIYSFFVEHHVNGLTDGAVKG